MVYSGAWGKLIHEKKISWHCPFKYKQMRCVQGCSSTCLPGAGAGAAQDGAGHPPLRTPGINLLPVFQSWLSQTVGENTHRERKMIPLA